MHAIAKVRPGPGFELVDLPEPAPGPGQVKIRVEAASVCGTDLHIDAWDAWAASRVHPPRILGHEFCGAIVDVGPGVDRARVGEFVASESHIACGRCLTCLAGQGHACPETKILGVDVDGGFAEFAVVPTENARTTDRSVPVEIAAFQDALGNAVHTAMAGPVADQAILITGMGPIGLFAAAVCRALGAARVIATEISPYRRCLAEAVGADLVLDPNAAPPDDEIRALAPEGVDAALEMSGHPAALDTAIRATRPGGRVSMLGVYAEARQTLDLNRVIFAGLTLQGIVGRRLWGTWDEMAALLASGRLNLAPVVTHRMGYADFALGIELMHSGEAGKVVFDFAPPLG